MKFILRYFTVITLVVLSLTMWGQPRKIEEMVSAEVNRKANYFLIQSIIHYKEFQDTPLKSVQARNAFKESLKTASRYISLDLDRPEPEMDVLIKLVKDSQIGDFYFSRSHLIRGNSFDYLSATLPLRNMEDVAKLDAVLAIEPSYKNQQFVNDCVTDSRAVDVWQGNLNDPLSHYLTGKGVFVGIIDGEPNRSHITFQDENNQSRFNEFPLVLPDGHGTHVAGIAAGKGDASGNYRGVAFESDLLWYPHSTFIDVAEIVDKMILDSGNQPLVINYSGGTVFGPRDGTAVIEECLDDILVGNKIMVCAASNNSTRNMTESRTFMHFGGVVPGNVVDFLEIEVKNVGIPMPIEIWYPDTLSFDVMVSGNNNLYEFWSERISPGVYANVTLPLDTYNPYSDDYISVVNSAINKYREDYEPANNSPSRVISIQYNSADESFEGGNYKIRLFPQIQNRGGRIDAYVCLNWGDKGGFLSGDDYQTINTPAWAHKVITVAASDKERDGGEIAYYSSLGPSRADPDDLSSKPDITSVGGTDKSKESAIRSASHDSEVLFENYNVGTSMAAPVVTGAIALLMQCFPDLDAVQVKDILQKSAGPIPNGHEQETMTLEDKKYWGAGKLDILAAFKSMAGFSYFRPYSYDDQKYSSAFAAHSGAGLPYGPVIYNWGSIHFSHQKFTNGAIFLDNSVDSAHWLGEGIWNKWVELGAYESLLGIPVCSEFPDMANNGFATVRFENGEIYWDGFNPFVIYYVHPKFTYDISEGSAPLQVRFTDLTRVDSGTVTSWLWDFGDGMTSTEQNPVHLYETPGTYQVKLTVEVNNKLFSTTGLGFITVVQGVPGTAVSYMEYFFDQDPGLGQGIPLSAGASPFVSLQTNISLAGLSVGLHRLYLRARDTNGLWSQLHSRPVLISPESLPGPVDRVEYFFDDPVANGAATALNHPASTDVSIDEQIDISTLAPGMHRLYFRAKESSGLWSQLHSRPVLISPESLSGPVDRIEYFVDDPVPAGSGFGLSFSPATDVSLSGTLPLEDLSPGLHRLFFRAKNETGQWSALHSRPLLVSGQPSGKPDITRVEYFFNQDPGMGLATPLTFVASDSVAVQDALSVEALTSGDHTIGFRAMDSFGLWSQPRFAGFSLLDEVITLKLQAGWNIVSLFIQPDPADLMSVFQPLIDAGILVKVVDEAGHTLENLGSLGGWVNPIGAWQETEGYKVYVNQATDLSVTGSRIPLPATIPLSAGWNMISFPDAAVQDAMASLGLLREAGVLIKVMDEAGNAMEDLGWLGGWVNFIGDFLPGKGYKVRVSASTSLVISADAPKSATLLRRLRPSDYFRPVFIGHGTNHFNLHLVDPAASGLRDGDELAIFDGALCVGSATVDAQSLAAPLLSLSASANDGLGAAAAARFDLGSSAPGYSTSANDGMGSGAPGTLPNGFTSGHPLSLRLYREGREWPLTVESLTNTGQPGPPLLFSANGSAIARIQEVTTAAPQVSQESFQVSCYPNPFSEEVTLLVRMADREMLSVDVHDQLGRKIRSLHAAPAQGTLSLVWDGRDTSGHPCAPGLYFCRVNSQVLKIMLSRFPAE